MSTNSNEGKDLFGGKYWEDENGKRVYEKTGPFGKKYWEDEEGNQTHERTGPLGGKYYEDSDGRKTHERTGPLGGKYYEGSDGKQTHKRTGPFGGSYLEKDEGAAFIPSSFDKDNDQTNKSTKKTYSESRSLNRSGILGWLSKQGIFSLFVIAVVAIAVFIVIGIPILGGLLLIRIVNGTLIAKAKNQRLLRWTSFPVLFILGFLLTSELVGMAFWGFSCVSPDSSRCAAYVRQPYTTILGWHENIVYSMSGTSMGNTQRSSDVEGTPAPSTNSSAISSTNNNNDVSRWASLTAQQIDSRINLRAQADQSSTSRGYGLVGDSVEILNETLGSDGTQWYHVKFPVSEAEGWIRGDFVVVNSTDLSGENISPSGTPTLHVTYWCKGGDEITPLQAYFHNKETSQKDQVVLELYDHTYTLNRGDGNAPSYSDGDLIFGLKGTEAWLFSEANPDAWRYECESQ